MRKSVIVGLALAAGAAGLGGCASGSNAGAVLYAQPAAPNTFVAVGIDQAAGWTMAAFHDLGITVTDDVVKDHGLKREIEGTASTGEKVEVEIEPKSDGSTTVNVTARKSSLESDRGLAQSVLNQILSKKDQR